MRLKVAFLGHDAGHNGITHIRKYDQMIGIFVGNFCNGIGISWWKNTHNVHHIMTNSADCDPDIQVGETSGPSASVLSHLSLAGPFQHHP